MFTSAKRKRVSSLVIEQIKEAILSGEVKPGDLLPSEKELIEQFGVSKHSLREALRTLEAMGFITIKRGAGGGPVVSEIGIDKTRESFANFLHFQNVSVKDLTELRVLIEPYLAKRAAESFTEKDIAQLHDYQKRCEAIYEQGQSLVGAEAEIGFHTYLAKHTGNPVLLVVLDFVNNLLTSIKKDVIPGKEFTKEVLDAHERVIAAIEAKDPEESYRAMLMHVREVAESLEKLKK
ncbi:MAG: FadR family transcriptional regulator [Desulfovibrionales bacterium]|nr:FadR family transcriptional regulator [Desulfovibrionales bacterium]